MGKSDESAVPATTANNGAAKAPAEPFEERRSAKRNVEQAALHRTPSRIKLKSRGLNGVREAVRKDSTLKSAALLHHVNKACLTEAFFNLKKTAAVGVDGITWHEYEQNVEDNIAVLHDRIHLEPQSQACNQAAGLCAVQVKIFVPGKGLDAVDYYSTGSPNAKEFRVAERAPVECR